jgi:tetratricopeptide (TPR) repeat protein
MQYPSVRLFVDRAQAVRPDFQVTPANAAAVGTICARLEGLPLSIELAAARVGVMTPAVMLARLDQRLEWLSSRQRGIPSRHGSLRAALDWSYQLLPLEPRRFFARLSVFRGGWTLEAAEAICEEVRAGERLMELRDASLVLAEGAEGDTRYRMLETLREYGSDQVSPEEKTELKQRHLDYYLSLAEQAASAMAGPEQGRCIQRLEEERENLRAALDRAQASGQVEAGLRVAVALRQFWVLRAHLPEGRERLARLLLHADAVPRPLYARALNAAGKLAVVHNDFEPARYFHEQALSIWRQLGDDQGIATTLRGLGEVAGRQRDYDTARPLYEQSRDILNAIGSGRSLAATLNDMGLIAALQNDFVVARTALEESIAICRKLGDRLGTAAPLSNLGIVALGQGRYADACSLFRESMAIKWELGDRLSLCWTFAGLAEAAAAEGHKSRAVRWFSAAEALRTGVGGELPPSTKSALLSLRSSMEEEQFATAWTEGEAMPLAEAIEEILQSEPA